MALATVVPCRTPLFSRIPAVYLRFLSGIVLYISAVPAISIFTRPQIDSSCTVYRVSAAACFIPLFAPLSQIIP